MQSGEDFHAVSNAPSASPGTIVDLTYCVRFGEPCRLLAEPAKAGQWHLRAFVFISHCH